MDSRVEEAPDASSSSSIESSLLERVREHDRDAWQRLVHLYSPLIYDWCRRQGLQSADAADVMQETFRSVSTSIDQFRDERPGDSFRGWLWTITRNKIRDHFRSKADRANAAGGTAMLQRLNNLPDAEPPSVSEAPKSQTVKSPLARAMDMIRGDFGEATWQAFLRLTIQGHAAAEVAADLGISVNAVRKAKARVLRRLREEFGDLLD